MSNFENLEEILHCKIYYAGPVSNQFQIRTKRFE